METLLPSLLGLFPDVLYKFTKSLCDISFCFFCRFYASFACEGPYQCENPSHSSYTQQEIYDENGRRILATHPIREKRRKEIENESSRQDEDQ